MTSLQIALIIVAGILAIVELIRTRAQGLIAWAVLAVVIALLFPVLR
jgi:hypothetical protein